MKYKLFWKNTSQNCFKHQNWDQYIGHNILQLNICYIFCVLRSCMYLIPVVNCFHEDFIICMQPNLSYTHKLRFDGSTKVPQLISDLSCYLVWNKNSLGAVKKGTAKQSRINKTSKWYLTWLVRTSTDIKLWPSIVGISP